MVGDIIIEPYKFYEAEVRVKDKSTLKTTEVPHKDGDIIRVGAGWILDTGNYAGQWAMIPRFGLWYPQEDLILIREITLKEYYE